jgi:hypothetical protein
MQAQVRGLSKPISAPLRALGLRHLAKRSPGDPPVERRASAALDAEVEEVRRAGLPDAKASLPAGSGSRG